MPPLVHIILKINITSYPIVLACCVFKIFKIKLSRTYFSSTQKSVAFFNTICTPCSYTNTHKPVLFHRLINTVFPLRQNLNNTDSKTAMWMSISAVKCGGRQSLATIGRVWTFVCHVITLQYCQRVSAIVNACRNHQVSSPSLIAAEPCNKALNDTEAPLIR